MTGIAASTNKDNRGLVTTIIAAPPKNSSMFRKATDTEATLMRLVSSLRSMASLPGSLIGGACWM